MILTDNSTVIYLSPFHLSFHPLLPLVSPSFSQVGFEGKLYVFGGCGAKGRMRDLYAFDIGKGTWEALPSKEEMKVGGEKERGREGKKGGREGER